MVKWQSNLLTFDKPQEQQLKIKPRSAGLTTQAVAGLSKPSKLQTGDRGCAHCPLDKVPGLNKIKNLDQLTGKKIMVWAQNPGQEENKRKLELVGPAGKLLWGTGAQVGLKREDCDIQNVVRCATFTTNEFNQTVNRPPDKSEIHCCSLYNEEALLRVAGRTKVHLVLGQVAAKSLLKGEYRKDTKTFFSQKLNAFVVITYHPSYFLRGAPRSKLNEFKEALAFAAEKAGQSGGKFHYIESQDYRVVRVNQLEEELERPIYEAAKRGERVSVDIEDDKDEAGNNVIVCVGFSWAKGMARIVFLQHPEVKQTEQAWGKKIAVLKKLLEDPQIRKTLQFGTYDVWKLKKLLGITMCGYDHDTMYSEYIRFTHRKAFGLEAIADVRFREFAGYKEILAPYKDASNIPKFLKIPLKIIVVYNGADCDITKRIEKDNRNRVNYALLQVFIKASAQLARMGEVGPWFDKEYVKILNDWIPAKLTILEKKIRAIVKKEKFNPRAPLQVSAVVYDQLQLGKHLDEKWKKKHPRSTDKETMLMLANFHEFPGLIMEHRGLDKKKGTYIDGFTRSADLHGGRATTQWWLAGTISGRLRSGGERGKKQTKGIVNLQNVHGAAEIENMLVSDLRWRELYACWQKGV